MSFLEFQRALGAVMFLSEMRPKKECKPEVMATLLQLLAGIEHCIDKSNPCHLQFLIAGNPRKIAKDNLSGLLDIVGVCPECSKILFPKSVKLSLQMMFVWVSAILDSVAVFIPMFLPPFSDIPIRLVLDTRQSCILTTSLMAFKSTQVR